MVWTGSFHMGGLLQFSRGAGLAGSAGLAGGAQMLRRDLAPDREPLPVYLRGPIRAQPRDDLVVALRREGREHGHRTEEDRVLHLGGDPVPQGARIDPDDGAEEARDLL